MRRVPDNLYIDEAGTVGVREFRVSQDARYKVTDWASFNTSASVRTVADNLTLAEANEIASAMGKLYPGALVNGMDPPLNGLPPVNALQHTATDPNITVKPGDLLGYQTAPGGPITYHPA